MKALRDSVGGIDESEYRGFSLFLYESALKASTNKWEKGRGWWRRRAEPEMLCKDINLLFNEKTEATACNKTVSVMEESGRRAVKKREEKIK